MGLLALLPQRLLLLEPGRAGIVVATAFNTSSCSEVGGSDRMSVVVDSWRNLFETAEEKKNAKNCSNCSKLVQAIPTWPKLHQRTVLVNPQLRRSAHLVQTGDRNRLVEGIHQRFKYQAKLKINKLNS